MTIDVIKLIFLMFGTMFLQDPKINTDVEFRIVFTSGGAAVLELAVDPWVQGKLQTKPCGMTFMNVMALREGASRDCFEHELAHIRQGQALGLAMPILYGMNRDWFEDYEDTDNRLLIPRGLNYPLIRFSLPVRWDRCQTFTDASWRCKP